MTDYNESLPLQSVSVPISFSLYGFGMLAETWITSPQNASDDNTGMG